MTKIITDLLLTPLEDEGGQDVLDEDEEDSTSAVLVAVSEGDADNDGADPNNRTELNTTLEKRRILKLFVYSPEDDVFTAKINSVLKLNMVAKFVAVGVSFRQASRLYQTVKEETGMVSWDRSLIMKQRCFVVSSCAQLNFST